MDWLTDPNVWASFLTLSALEIVLGIDNLVFISVATSRLPEARQAPAQRTGLLLALSFLLLIGLALIADGLHFHIPRGYLYFAIAFSIGVEALNLLAKRRRVRPRI